MSGLLDDSLLAGQQAFSGLGAATADQAQSYARQLANKDSMEQGLLNFTSTTAHGVRDMIARHKQQALQDQQEKAIKQERPVSDQKSNAPQPIVSRTTALDQMFGGIMKFASGGILDPAQRQLGLTSSTAPAPYFGGVNQESP